MSYVKFNHVFAALMLLALLGGFVIPPRYTSKAVPQLQALFAPVSVPARGAGVWVRERVAPDASRDLRSVQDVKAENQRLRDAVTTLSKQLELETQRNAQWARLGSFKDQGVLVDVVGGDSSARDSLSLEGSTLARVRDGDVVMFPGGMVGQIQGRAGVAGSQARLITDRGFKVRGHFVRVEADGRPRQLTTHQVLFEGVGNGAMIVRPPLKSVDVQGMKLRAGDIAVVDEPDWPSDVAGRHLGTITRIEPDVDEVGWHDIRVEPVTNLEKLREVMVLVKKKS